jgi:hypothetical protein
MTLRNIVYVVVSVGLMLSSGLNRFPGYR